MINKAALDQLSQAIHSSGKMHTVSLSANDLGIKKENEMNYHPFLSKRDRHLKKPRNFESKKVSIQKQNFQGRARQWTATERITKMTS